MVYGVSIEIREVVLVLMRGIANLLGSLRRHYGMRGVLARTWPSGSMVMWVALLLMMYLALFYLA